MPAHTEGEWLLLGHTEGSLCGKKDGKVKFSVLPPYASYRRLELLYQRYCGCTTKALAESGK